MPSRISMELSPASALDPIAILSNPCSSVTNPSKMIPTNTAISTSPSNSAKMDDATLCLQTSSPSSSSSVSFSSSASSSPSSSTTSLPQSPVYEANHKGKGQDYININESKGKGKGKGPTQEDSQDEQNSVFINNHQKSTLYSYQIAASSNSTSVSSLPSVNEDEEFSTKLTLAGSTGKGKSSTSSLPSYDHSSYSSGPGSGSGSGSRSSHPKAASSSGYSPYSNNLASGSSSKPALARASSSYSTNQLTHATSTFSSAIPSVPAIPSSYMEKDSSAPQDLSQYSYDAIPDDFDFGDLPFYDTDPRTGKIYGDPYAIVRQHIVRDAHVDIYSFAHDTTDPRKTNVFNKYGSLVYYHPGRHIGQEQDSLRSQFNNQPTWTMIGRTSTWGSLTATEMPTKRQIKIMMESNKKKAAANHNEPVARFVFRWKEDDFVIEYRKQKDQYRITCSQMCGGESKWKPPQVRITQAMFHGAGLDTPITPSAANPNPIGIPSPFDDSRYLQLISEYRLNSGPVLKKGDFELYNPDTFPQEFKTFLILTSIVVLDVMRPVDDKEFYKQFPDAYTKNSVPKIGGLNAGLGPMINGRPGNQVVVPSPINPIKSASASTVSVDKSNSGSVVDLSSSIPKQNSNTQPSISMPVPQTSEKPTPLKKSRWGSFFKK